MSVTQLLKLPYKIRRHAVNAESNQLVKIHVLVALLLQFRYPLRRRPMNSHGDELVRVRLVARLLEAPNHFRDHPVNAEGDSFVAFLNLLRGPEDPRNDLLR